MSEKTTTLTINIPIRIVEEIEKIIPNTSYTSVVDYVERKISLLYPAGEVYSQKETEVIKKRLQSLGYLR